MTGPDQERRATKMVQYHIEGEHVFPEPECPSCRLDEAQRKAALLAGARRWQPTESEPRYWEAVEGWAEAVSALRGRCYHQESYELRNDGASEIYSDIMHDGECSDETACVPCSNCEAIRSFIIAMLGEKKSG